MFRKIGLKTHKLFALVLTSTLFIPTIAQAQEKTVAAPSQIYDKAFVSGHRISGTVIMDPNGQPIAKADIEVRAINAAAGKQLFSRRTQTDERGRWTIDKVPEGDYLLFVVPGNRLAPDKDGWFKEMNSHSVTQFVASKYELKVSEAGIEDFAVKVIKGGRISGKITMDGGESFPEGLVVLPEQKVKDGKSPARTAPVQPDGSFVLEGVPLGDIFLKVLVFGKVKEFYTISATVNDIDLLRETFHIEDGSDVKDVQVVFAKAKGNK